MALDRLTKVDGGGISTTSDYRVGIITASKFVGPFDGTGGNFTGVITATDGNFSGNVTIGGTLTYEDVTNIDSVGIITAQKDIHVGAGLSVVGVTTFSSNVNLGDNDKIILGSGNRFSIYDNGTSAIIDNTYGSGSILRLGSGNQVVLGSPLSNNQTLIRGVVNGPSELYHAGAKKLETLTSGINVTGNTVADGLTIDGDSDLNGDLDVDGHTNLDNLNIAGVTTVASDQSFIIGSNATPKFNIDFKQNSSNGRNSINSFYLDFSFHDIRFFNESGGSHIAYFWPSTVTLFSGGVEKFKTKGDGITVFGVGDGHGILLDNTTFRNNITAESNRPGANNSILELDGKWNNTQVAFMTLSTGDDTTNKDDGRIRFFTKPSGGTIAERARIETDGKLNLYNDLDVDGHTNLDNVSIAGVTTFTGAITANSTLYVGSDLTITNKIVHNGDTDTYLQFTPNTINLHSGGTTGLSVLDASVRVPTKLGINGAAPQAPLDVIANGSGYAMVIRGRSSDNTAELRFTSNDYGSLYGTIIGGPTYLKFATGGTPRWQMDSSGHLLPNTAGAVNIGSASAGIGNVFLPDDKTISLGNDEDLQISHSSGNVSLITSPTSRQLQYKSDGGFLIRGTGNQMIANFLESAVTLYKSQQIRLTTTSTGITVGGEVAASQDYPDLRPTLDLNFAAVKKLDPRITYYRTGPASFTDEFGKVVLVGDNKPRFDHDPVTRESKGILIEESRTNIAPYSNDMSPYNGYNITNTANNAVAPDGTTTATKVNHGGSGTSYLDYTDTSINAAGAGSYTYSVWLKAPDDQPDGYYGCQLAVLHSSGGNVEPTVSLNKTWTRYTVTKTFGASDPGYLRVHIVMFRAAPGATYGGKVIPSYVWAWGAQIEAGAFATSYIPTAGATRGADVVRVEGEEFSEFYNDTENTTIMVGKRLGNLGGADGRVYSISDGTNNNRIDWDLNDGTNIRFSVSSGGTTVTNQEISSWSDIDKEFKIAAGMAVNNQISVVNGTAIAAADTSCAMPAGVDRLYFGLRGNEGNQGSLTIKRFMLYPKRLPDSQLVTLTS